MKLTRQLLTLIASGLFSSLLAAVPVITVNYTDGGPGAGPASATNTAGVVPGAYIQTIAGNAEGKSGTVAGDLKDNSGTSTGVGITASGWTAGSYFLGFSGYNIPSGTTQSNKMMENYSQTTGGSITLTGLSAWLTANGFAACDVYYYSEKSYKGYAAGSIAIDSQKYFLANGGTGNSGAGPFVLGTDTTLETAETNNDTANYVMFSGVTGDTLTIDVALDGGSGNLSVNGLQIVAVEGTPTAAPKITSITSLGTGLFQLTLQGKAETDYEFRSSTIMDFDPGTLVENLTPGDPVVGTIGGTMNSVLTTDIDGDATVQMTLTGDPADFVRAQIPPPVTLFSETFDGVTGPGLPDDWTTDVNTADTGTTQWQLGEPSTVGPDNASSGLNCVATNLSADYGTDTDIWLRTPEIDLGTATAGTLSFQQWTQIEDEAGDYDYGSIRILDASDNSELAVLENQTIDGSTTDWEEYSIPLPDEAFTSTEGQIKVEFRFESDFIANYAGWYIDDVTVTAPGS